MTHQVVFRRAQCHVTARCARCNQRFERVRHDKGTTARARLRRGMKLLTAAMVAVRCECVR